jgi:alpha-beta hydrolase superfamily lysophospholipase
MAARPSEELVYTTSEDGIALTGVTIRPSDGPIRPVAIVWIHGNTGSFSDYPYVAVGRALARRGYHFVSGNSRGHDIGATLWRLTTDRPVAGGSAWERLEESPRDLAAWVGLAMERDARAVALVGHSLGAVKVIRYQAERQDPRIAGVALASPTCTGTGRRRSSSAHGASSPRGARRSCCRR